ncbi:MAG: outer membrane beta-barrel protein [Bacteroidota bacterium]
MNKLLFCFSLLILTFSMHNVNAQGVTLEGLNFGAFIGPNLTLPNVEIVPNDPNDEVSGGVGIEGGAVVDYGFTPHLGVQSGLIISTRGFKRTTEVPNLLNPQELITLSSNQNLTTLAVPITFRVRPGSTISKVSIFGTLGIIPEINFSYRNKFDTMSVVQDGNGNDVLQIDQMDDTSKENVNVFTASGQAGLGVLAGGAFVKGTFNFALTEIIENVGIRAFDETVKLHYITLSVGYFF